MPVVVEEPPVRKPAVVDPQNVRMGAVLSDGREVEVVLSLPNAPAEGGLMIAFLRDLGMRLKRSSAKVRVLGPTSATMTVFMASSKTATITCEVAQPVADGDWAEIRSQLATTMQSSPACIVYPTPEEATV